MKKVKFNLISVLIIFVGFIQTGVSQENMNINMSDGTVMEIPIDDIQKLTFDLLKSYTKLDKVVPQSIRFEKDAEIMQINMGDGTIMEIPIVDIQKLTFDLHVGMFKSNLTGSKDIDIIVYPNPSNNGFTIDYSLSSTDNVSITITNVIGEKILSKNIGTKKPGKHTYSLENGTLPSGTYICHLRTKNGIATKKIIVKQ